MRFRASLAARLAVAAAILGAGGAVVLVTSVRSYLRSDFQRNTIDSASSVTELIRRSMRAAMLRNSWQDVREIMENIHAQREIVRIRLLRKDGTIAMSSDASEVGRKLSVEDAECRGCHVPGPPRRDLPREDRVRVFKGADGSRVLGMIEPILNEPACSGACHVHPPGKGVLGVIDTQLSLAHTDAATDASVARLIGGSTAVVLLTASGIVLVHAWMLRRRLRPVLATIGRLGRGDYGARIPPGPRDELSEASLAFNRMAHELEDTHQELRDWANTLQDRVEARTHELHQTQKQVIQSERLACLGRIAAVVAHELNNPLAGVLVLARRAQKMLRRGDIEPQRQAELATWLETIDTEVARCGKIVQDLLVFSRNRPPSREPVDVNEVVRRAARLLGHKLSLDEIDLTLELAENASVVGDGGQLQQVLMALMINAVEAMPQGGGLTIATRERAGGGIEIEVKDTGSGIAPEDLPHIFEPFFTTKPEGQGVGLGLAVVYGIVSRHGGRIDVASEPGEGTRFVVQLPPEPPPDSEVRSDIAGASAAAGEGGPA
ncbi:MAG: HAMP domain-containing protein [Acidobacteria bacterium]|nr:HAMP domain-containing protein [Acidobacteriota bacterium]